MLTTALTGYYHEVYLDFECDSDCDIYQMQLEALEAGEALRWVERL